MLVINLFGAPGSGKSTLALLIGGLLKTQHPHISCEVPNEVPKFLVYDESLKSLKCQPLVMGQQFWQIARCEGHADVVITDSPVLLSAVYGREYGQDTPEAFTDVCYHYHCAFPSINYYVERRHEYENKARIQNEDESRHLENRIKTTLSVCAVETEIVHSGYTDAEKIVAQIIERLKCQEIL